MTNDEIELPKLVGPLRALDDELKEVIRTYAKGCVALAIRADRERAQAAEPVAEVVSKFGDPEAFGERDIKILVDLRKIPYRTKLYPAPARPAVTDDMVERACAGGSPILKWPNDYSEQEQAMIRKNMRYALEAALGGGDVQG